MPTSTSSPDCNLAEYQDHTWGDLAQLAADLTAENECLRALLRRWLAAEEPWLHPQDELVCATRAALEVSDG